MVFGWESLEAWEDILEMNRGSTRLEKWLKECLSPVCVGKEK